VTTHSVLTLVLNPV